MVNSKQCAGQPTDIPQMATKDVADRQVMGIECSVAIPNQKFT